MCLYAEPNKHGIITGNTEPGAKKFMCCRTEARGSSRAAGQRAIASPLERTCPPDNPERELSDTRKDKHLYGDQMSRGTE